MANNRPLYRITWKYRDKEKGWENDLECAVWPPHPKAPDGAPPSVSFPRGSVIELEDGRRFKTDDFWPSLKENTPPNGQRKRRAVDFDSDDLY